MKAHFIASTMFYSVENSQVEFTSSGLLTAIKLPKIKCIIIIIIIIIFFDELNFCQNYHHTTIVKRCVESCNLKELITHCQND